jgi:hypothetical protein
MARKLPEITIIKDTREQKGWDFLEEEKVAGKVRVAGMEVATMDAADYTIKGAEDLVRIERKYGFTELFNNMTPLESKYRFEREMEKLRAVKHRYLVIETSLNDDILALSIPQLYKGPTANRVLSWITELEMEYGIVPIYAGSCGRRVARHIFDNIARRYL